MVAGEIIIHCQAINLAEQDLCLGCEEFWSGPILGRQVFLVSGGAVVFQEWRTALS
jgi:hypothetical protein